MKTKTERKGSPTDILRRDQRTHGLSGASGRPQVKAGQKQVKLLLHYPPALGGHTNRDSAFSLLHLHAWKGVWFGIDKQANEYGDTHQECVDVCLLRTGLTVSPWQFWNFPDTLS